MTPEEYKAKFDTACEAERLRMEQMTPDELHAHTRVLAQRIVDQSGPLLKMLHEAQERTAHPLTWKLRRWLRGFSAKSSAK